MRHIISILLQNEAGALSRVASMFASRGYNIESLSVAPTEHNALWRLTLVSSGSDEVIQQINKQLEKLVDVVKIADMTLDAHIERELLLMKVKVTSEHEESFASLVNASAARVLDDSPETYTLELTGASDRIDEFIQQIDAFAEILAVVRSGAMAIARGQNVLNPG